MSHYILNYILESQVRYPLLFKTPADVLAKLLYSYSASTFQDGAMQGILSRVHNSTQVANFAVKCADKLLEELEK